MVRQLADPGKADAKTKGGSRTSPPRRLDSGNISDLQTRELFETPAGVFSTLHKACDDAE
jgi:hypothetical protein